MFRFRSILLALLAVNSANAQCNICADVDLQQETETQVPLMQSDKTCDTLKSEVSGLADGSDECGNKQLEAYQIGCCTRPPFFHCTICPDGSDHERQNVIPLGTGARDPTCAEGQFRANLFLAPFEIGNCEDTFARRSAHYCGCPGVTQDCTLCPDGAAPLKTDDEIAFAFNNNCNGVQYLYSLFSSQDCVDVPLTYGFDGAAFCRCPNYSAQEDFECSLCGEGKVVPDRSKIWTGSNIEWTCGQAEDNAKYFNRQSSCDDLLATAREECGCVSSATQMGVMMTLVVTGVAALSSMLW